MTDLSFFAAVVVTLKCLTAPTSGVDAGIAKVVYNIRAVMATKAEITYMTIRFAGKEEGELSGGVVFGL